ncbi:hypothetical protein EDC04DRAFT_2689004 [Pisolithus marmoratus]|nr:hypothetical protein EDC04DRAFT_2689004 [Pisolithus marmoratus]
MVTLFGKIGTSNGSYTIQLDGGQANTYNALVNLPYYGVTLFHADNLGSGQHILTVTNTPNASGQGLGIDYALVSNLLSASNSSTSSSKKLSTGAIVGIAVPAAIAALSFSLVFYFYRKWKAAQATENQLRSIHASQWAQEVAVGFTTSLDAQRNAYQRSPDGGPGGTTYPFRSAISRPRVGGPVELVPLSSQPPEGSRRGPFDHPRLEGEGVHGQVMNSPGLASPTSTDLPNYSEVEWGGR